jgi:hypothetical protein
MSSRALPLTITSFALVLGAWVRRAALHAGFWSDDYLQYAMLRRAYPSTRPSWDLFRFADGSSADTQRLLDFGYYPWWTHAGFKLSMLRPLASLLHAFDYGVFGLDAHAHHLHSLAWWCVLVIAVGALLFTLLPRGAAAAALILFALDESHTVPLLWLSNRSTLIATALAAAGLCAHVHWRRSQAGALRSLSIALFALALASGEYALAMFGYLVCFEFSTRFDGTSRTRALMPAAILCGAFVVIWAGLGYGTAHSGLYTNPVRSSAAFAVKLSTGLPVLLGELVLGVPADAWSFGSPWPEHVRALGLVSAETWEGFPSWHAVQLGLGVCSALIVVGLLRLLRGRLAREDYVAVRALVGGALLALLPVLGSFITTRLVVPASIGFAALFGSVLCSGIVALARGRQPGAMPQVVGSLVLIALVIYVHGFRAVGANRGAAGLYSHAARSRTAWPLSAQIDSRRAARTNVIMVAASDVNDAPYLPFVRFAHGLPLVKGFHLLSGSPGSHQLTRIDARTLEVALLGTAGLAGSVVGSLTRSARETMRAGERVVLPGLAVSVLETAFGQPVRMRYTFDVPLEDESLLWLQSGPRGLQRLELPAVGQSVQLPPPMPPDVNLVTHRRHS